MSLHHAILTSLAEQPGSGLELARRFDKSIGHFWSATHQQIYRELAKLEKLDFIESKPDEEARGGKKIYHLLDQGRDELARWVGLADSMPSLRDSMLVRLRAEAVIGPCDLSATIKKRLDEHRALLAQYHTYWQRDFSEHVVDRKEALQRLILKSGIRHEESWIDILEEAQRILMEE